MQLGACDFGLALLRRPGGAHTMQCKDVLGEIDCNVQNRQGLSFPSELMKVRTSHRGTAVPVAALRLARDEEVPFIR